MATVTATMRTLDLRSVQHTALTGEHVWKLQVMLNIFLRSGDEAAESTPLVDDGVAGPRTRAALLTFQKTYALATDAIAGPLTWRALLEFDVTGRF